ncbi:amidohydrolase family protein [Candidatus Poriferisocius sp.]|uniref:amidohydrolase family protein n=1 Tax=Candidatus Poriferisocius sp. TaxID=3101276 RepID=UPI003B5CEE88
MIDGMYVIDGVAHGYNWDISNFRSTRVGEKFREIVYPHIHEMISPLGTDFVMTKDEFLRTCSPETLVNCLFAESQTDLAVYHEVPLFGFVNDGGSPMSIGEAAAEIASQRFLFYGAVRPYDTANAIDRIDEQLENTGILGLKLYPNDVWEGKVTRLRLDDEEITFPILQHAVDRGIKTVAIHKAWIFGPSPIEPFKLDDLERAILSFKNLNFEIVHGGWAFVEETVMLAQNFSNVYINLEGPSAFAGLAPERFAHIIGPLLRSGAEDQIIWATGAMAAHPRPMVEALAAFVMPEHLVQGYGYPELTMERKAKILGENFARMHGFDLADRVNAIDDQFTGLGKLAAPWSALRQAA